MKSGERTGGPPRQICVSPARLALALPAAMGPGLASATLGTADYYDGDEATGAGPYGPSRGCSRRRSRRPRRLFAQASWPRRPRITIFAPAGPAYCESRWLAAAAVAGLQRRARSHGSDGHRLAAGASAARLIRGSLDRSPRAAAGRALPGYRGDELAADRGDLAACRAPATIPASPTALSPRYRDRDPPIPGRSRFARRRALGRRCSTCLHRHRGPILQPAGRRLCLWQRRETTHDPAPRRPVPQPRAAIRRPIGSRPAGRRPARFGGAGPPKYDPGPAQIPPRC